MTAVTVVLDLSKVERQKHNTAKPASASIPSIRTQAALEHVGILNTWATATAMMRTTTAVVATIWVTAADQASKKPTARSAHAKIQSSRTRINQRAVPRSTKETAIATTKTTTQAVSTTIATAVLKPSRA